MSSFICCIWWLVFGVLLGWLLAWILSKCCNKSRLPGADSDASQPQNNFIAAPSAAPINVSRADMIKTAATAGIIFAGKKNDLEIIEGIGPKIAELLNNNGIHSFAELGNASLMTLNSILEKGGDNFRLANPGTWAEQALLAAEHKWQELKTLQDQLDGGVKKR